MIIKQREMIENKNEVITRTFFFECNKFSCDYTTITTDKGDTISISDYEVLDEITNNFDKHRVMDVYVMNDKGQTIERIR